MNSKDIDKNIEDSLLAKIGENYHFLKTILSNKLEIAKLEFLQKISAFVSLLIFSIISIFVIMAILTIFIVSLIVYLEGLLGSYLSALLLTNGILILLTVIFYFLVKPKIKSLLAMKMMEIIETTNAEE